MSPMKRCTRLLTALRPRPSSAPSDDGKIPQHASASGSAPDSRPRQRCLRLAAMLAAVLLLQACAATATGGDRGPQAQVSSAAQPTPAPAARPMPIQPDTSCARDADCAVKNVGNCCGAYPACVNKDSPTDPAGVMARCQASGRMSVCGFRQIQSCQCRAGQCAETAALPALTSPTIEPRP